MNGSPYTTKGPPDRTPLEGPGIGPERLKGTATLPPAVTPPLGANIETVPKKKAAIGPSDMWTIYAQGSQGFG